MFKGLDYILIASPPNLRGFCPLKTAKLDFYYKRIKGPKS